MHLDYQVNNLVDQLHGNIEVHKGRVLGRDEVKAYIKRLLTGRASLPGKYTRPLESRPQNFFDFLFDNRYFVSYTLV